MASEKEDLNQVLEVTSNEEIQNAMSCMLVKVQEFCGKFDQNILMQSGTVPEKFIQNEYVQSELGSYAIFYAMVKAGYFDTPREPGSGLRALQATCRGFDSINNLLFGNPSRPGTAAGQQLDLRRLPILRDAMNTAGEILDQAEGKEGGKGSRKTKKKGRKGRKSRRHYQKGGVGGTYLNLLCRGLALAVFGSLTYGASVAAASYKLPSNFISLSTALANLLIQSNVIKDACDTTTGLTVRYLGSFVGLTQTCETIALENELQLANLSAYVSAMIVAVPGSAAILSWKSVSDIICDLIEKFFEAGTSVCSAAGRTAGQGVEETRKSIRRFLGFKIDQVSFELAHRRVSEYPVFDETVDAIAGAEENNEVITKGIIKMLVEARPAPKPFTLADLNNVITKFQEADAQRPAGGQIASIGYGIFARLVKATLGRDLSSPENIVRALQANTDFGDYFYECTKYPAGVNPDQVRGTPYEQPADAAQEEERRQAEELAAQEEERRQAEELAAQQQPLTATGNTATSSTATSSTATSSTAAQQQAAQQQRQPGLTRRRSSEGESKQDVDEVGIEGRERGAKRQHMSVDPNGGGRRRRRRTSKAKKHHKKGKKAHKSRKGKKAKRKTKKHHKKGKKAHRKSRKH